MTDQNDMMNLFALTNISETRILRIPVTNELQVELSQFFYKQEKEFLTEISDEIKFDGKYRPDDNELLVIEDFDPIDNLAHSIQNPLSYAELTASEHAIDFIRGIYTGYVCDNDVRILIQVFDRRRVISPKGFSIFHTNSTFKKFDGSGFTLDNKLTAIMHGKKLKFSSFHFVRQIFDMSAYYLEATNQDITDFSKLPSVQIEDQDAFIDACDTWVRRKIGTIMQSGVLDTSTPQQISLSAKHFSIDIKTNGPENAEKIVFPTDRAELKKLLRFLDEDYYQSPLTSNKYLSNSKRVIG